MNLQYKEFLKSKHESPTYSGFDLQESDIHPTLYKFQNAIVRWSLALGKSAIFAECGLGKGQPYGSQVLTPNGGVSIEHLKIGDKIIASDGKPHTVTGVYPKDEIDTYRFTFSDGATFVVDKDHLHWVRPYNDRTRGKGFRVMNTLEIIESGIRYGKNDKSRKYDIPIVKPIEFDKKELLIDPYLLGVLLGDGCLSVDGRVILTSGKDEIVNKVKTILKRDEMHLTQTSENISYNICGEKPNRNNHVLNALREYGLMGKKAQGKYIPSDYLFSSVSDRLELLRGLMDTDGWIGDTTQHYTTSIDLHNDVKYLIRSLGGIPTSSVKKGKYRNADGIIVECSDCYTLTFSLKTFNPFSLSYKAEKWNPTPRGNGRWIDNIEYVGKQKTVCISVDSPDQSYVTEDLIVTHNTFMQVEWSRHVSQHTNGRVIIVAPLAVTEQTVIEAEKIGITIHYVADESEMQGLPDDAIVITNYDRIHKFDCSQFTGVALDESSILKNFTGKTKQMLVETFRKTPYKLACTATPAPNDFLELGNHADFLDIMPSNEMIMRWFKNDTMAAGNYVLKSHGRDDFYRWLTSWAVCISHPRDLGAEYDMPNFDLPALNMVECRVGYSQDTLDRANEQGMLFPDVNVSSTGLHALKRESLTLRIEEAKRIVDTIDNNEPIIFWCDTNDEAKALEKAFPFAIEVNGSHKRDEKVEKLQSFTNQKHRAIITKPSIAGFGLNWQHCTNQILVGVSFSFEKTYQALRRSYRFGVKKPVNAFMVFSEAEGNVVQAIHNKQRQFTEMQTEMTKAMESNGLFRTEIKTELKTPPYEYKSGTNWELHLGDCVEQIAKIPDNSIDYGIHSPPFANLYIYSASEADMGNASDNDEFFKHYKYLIKEMYRTTKVGRLCSVHCKDLPLYKGRDGAMGLQDFAGDIIRAFEEMDKPDVDDYDSMASYKRDLAQWQSERKTHPKWVFHSRTNIWKDPVIEMQRTKNHGLLHKNFKKDASGVRQGMADYLITFRKWDVDNEDLIDPVTQDRVIGDYIGTEPPPSEQYEYSYSGLPMDAKGQQRAYSIAVWQRMASPVWFDIDQTNVLNHKIARGNDDEKHICPLQLDVIRKGIDLWSNEGDTVFSPFAGVGSELVTAIRMNRRAIGIELKESYFKTAIKHLKEAEKTKQQLVMF